MGLDFEKNVTKFYVTNWEGRVGLDLNMYDVLFWIFFFEVFPKSVKSVNIRSHKLVLN